MYSSRVFIVYHEDGRIYRLFYTHEAAQAAIDLHANPPWDKSEQMTMDVWSPIQRWTWATVDTDDWTPGNGRAKARDYLDAELGIEPYPYV